jgi:hypothetical protein
MQAARPLASDCLIAFTCRTILEVPFIGFPSVADFLTFFVLRLL